MKSNIEVIGITPIEQGWRLERITVEKDGEIEELIVETRKNCKTRIYATDGKVLLIELNEDKLERYLENYVPVSDSPISSAA